jgi:hypothetical protein
VTDTERIARRSCDAWTSGDGDTAVALRIDEQLTVRDGTIASSALVTDTVAFTAFAGSRGRDRS